LHKVGGGKDKKVFVIGGSSSIGEVIARQCLAEGATVWVASHSEGKLDTVRRSLGSWLRIERVDVDDERSVAELMAVGHKQMRQIGPTEFVALLLLSNCVQKRHDRRRQLTHWRSVVSNPCAAALTPSGTGTDLEARS
jgi:NAD(P)-dependent dehydrogenase (short-subunit alcohol dehydrogenase family)